MKYVADAGARAGLPAPVRRCLRSRTNNDLAAVTVTFCLSLPKLSSGPLAASDGDDGAQAVSDDHAAEKGESEQRSKNDEVRHSARYSLLRRRRPYGTWCTAVTIATGQLANTTVPARICVGTRGRSSTRGQMTMPADRADGAPEGDRHRHTQLAYRRRD